MTEKVRCLRPGVLVVMSTSIKGNKSYIVDQVEDEHTDAEGQLRAKWETTKLIADPVEHKLAVQTRGKVRSLITGVCVKSDFGYICPDERKDELQKRIDEAEKLTDAFNENSELSQLKFYVLRGQVAQDDVQAARALSSELQELVEKMQDGFAKMDADGVRDAANKMVSIGQMLSPDAKRQVDGTVKAVRAMCRQIKKAGDEIAIEIDDVVLDKLAAARTSFLNVDGGMLDLSAFDDDDELEHGHGAVLNGTELKEVVESAV